MLLWEDKNKIFDPRQANDSSRRISVVKILDQSIENIAKIATEHISRSLSAAREKQIPVNLMTRKNSNRRCCSALISGPGHTGNVTVLSIEKDTERVEVNLEDNTYADTCAVGI